jgi:hypothetical protein
VNTETITWHPVSEPPDADTMVLIFDPAASEPVWPGYLDGDAWRESEGKEMRPTHWADFPKGPAS